MNDLALENRIKPKTILYLILILALAFRLLLALSSDNFNHPDEIFQVLEQAHRLVFDYGFIPWEYRLDARSWIVPGLTAIFLYPFKLFHIDSPHIYIPGIKIIMALLSLLMVVAAYHIGQKWSSSENGGLWAAFFSAAWCDIAYFSVKPLSEVWGSFFFIAAIWLSLRRGRFSSIGSSFLAVLTAAVRINYLPVVLVFLVITAWNNRENSRPLILSAAAAVVLIGLFEWLTLGEPFVSYYNYYQIDKTFFMSGTIGSTLSLDYVLFLGYSSLFIVWLFIILALFYVRTMYLPIILILVGGITHVLIPAHDHQIAFRQIYLLIPMAMITGGAVLGRLLKKQRRNRPIITTVIISIFIAVSIIGSLGKLPLQHKIYQDKMLPVHRDTYYKNYDNLRAYLFLHHQEDLHGLYDNTDLWFKSGACYYLHRNVPVYFYSKKPPGPNFVSHFMTRGERKKIPGFELLKTIGTIDIYRRIDRNFIYPVDTAYNRFIFQPGVDYNDEEIHL